MPPTIVKKMCDTPSTFHNGLLHAVFPFFARRRHAGIKKNPLPATTLSANRCSPPRLRQVKERGVSSLAALSELDVNQQLSSPIPPPYGCVRPSAGGCRIAKRPTESARRSICCHRPASFRRK